MSNKDISNIATLERYFQFITGNIMFIIGQFTICPTYVMNYSILEHAYFNEPYLYDYL